MADYDSVGESWLPYVMHIQKNNIKRQSVSTDQYGFRNTIVNPNKILSYEEFVKNEKMPKAILIGGSTAFGVGANSDNFTITSVLNQYDKNLWFNFGGRGFN